MRAWIEGELVLMPVNSDIDVISKYIGDEFTPDKEQTKKMLDDAVYKTDCFILWMMCNG